MTQNTTPENDLVSIGLPVYNGEVYLEQAIASLQHQSYSNLEIIISDNCSTDRTSAICQELALQDDRIRYSRTERNIGAAGNFNRVVQLANGNLFAWANHDDLWAPSYVERCVEALTNAPEAVLAFTRSEKIDENGATKLVLNAEFGLDSPNAASRLRQYHDLFIGVDRRSGWGREPIEGFWIPVYGLMRTELLRRTPLIGNYISSDTILIEQLLMLGSFVEIEDRLFFKRDHRDRSMRDSEAYEARAEWFSGNRAGRLLFPRWRAFYERLTTALSLTDHTGDRIRCSGEMAYFYVRRPSEGKALAKEIIANINRLVASPTRRGQIYRKW